MNKLTKQQRSQALGWVSVMGFSPADLADHYGLTADEIAAELNDERKARKLAGKSPQPVPVVVNQGEKRQTGTGALINCLDALEAITECCERLSKNYAIQRIKFIAKDALRKTGMLIP